MKIFLVFLAVLGPIIPLSVGLSTCFQESRRTFSTTDVLDGEIFNVKVVSGTEYKEFDVNNSIGIDNNEMHTYFSFTTDSDSLVMSKTDSYKNFSKLAHADGNIVLISITIHLNCNDESIDEFISIKVTDSLSHSPEFGQQSYEYKVAMPIMPTLDITYYGTKIQVSEDNFSNKNMTFSIKPEDFSIDTISVSDKIFNASFSANKVLQFSENQTYTLTATNSAGNKSSVPIIIFGDEDSGLDNPFFQKAHYSFEYSDGGLEPKDGAIKVNSIKLNESQYDIEGDNKEHFKLTFDNSTGEFTLEVPDSLPSTLKGGIVLDLKFTTDTSTSTVLLINITEVIPTFSNGYYGGVYNPDANTIEWDVSPDVSEAVSLTIDQNVKTLFTVNQADFTITPSSELTAEDFDDNGNIIFTLTALSSTANEAEAAVVISLKSSAEAQLQFKDSYYEASYDADSNVTLNSQFAFKDLTDFTGIQISVDEPYNANFSIELKDDTWTVKVLGELSKDVLNKNTQLVVPITGTKSGLDGSAKAVLVLDLPEKVVIQFSELYYTGTYQQDDEKDSVHLDKAIKITGVDAEDAVFTVEGYKDYLTLSCSSDTCQIDVRKKFDDSILSNTNHLTMTITATYEDLMDQTVLVLDLPSNEDTDAQIQFKNIHYSAQYNVDSDTGKGSVDLNDGPIEFHNADNLSVTFEFEADYKDNFNLKCDVKTSSCEISVRKELENSTLAKSDQLIITITATASQDKLTSQTVLVLDLPSNEDTDAQIQFKKFHYSAQYIIDSETNKGSVNVSDGPIKFENNDDLSVSFDFEEDYNKNFKLKFNEDSSSYSIEVVNKLSDIDSTQLILTITATANHGQVTAHTVIILDLPITENILSFKESYYSAYYIPNSLKLTDTIVLESEDFSNLQFSFKDYDDYFEIESLSKKGQYNVTMKDKLNQTILEEATEIYVALMVTDSRFKLEASTVLAIKLPLYLNHVFEVDHYDAEYLKDKSLDLDKVNVNQKIKILDPDFTQLSVLGYEDNFSISCDPSTLECSLKLKKNLNSTSLSSNELFLTLVASTIDQFSTGKSLLLLKLPVKNSSFEFEKQLYQANYNTQSSEDELGTLSLVDAISLKEAYTTGISIVCDEYSDYFKFELAATGWELLLQKNIDAKVLSGQSQLITTLTASNSELTSFAKAAFIVNLPNKTSVAFEKLQYFGNYVSGDPPNVTMEEEIVISDPENSQIVLKSYSEIFEVIQKKTAWTIKPKTKLNDTILSQYSEINTQMSITKIGVSYGKALLTIRLPELTFSKERYLGSYVVDDEDVAKIEVESIQIVDVDENYVEVSLSEEYSQYFNITLKSGVCTVSVAKPLSSEITHKYGTLVSKLMVSRISDSRTLATSTLVITLPDAESTESPRFSCFSYYGDYKHSDKPTVELQHSIELAYDNQAVLESVKFENSSYASNFKVKQDDYNTYVVEVVEPLAQEILDKLTTVVLTLVANSSQNVQDYAALVVALPKTVRNSSVQVENQEILFSGTYDNGVFSSPQISLEFDNTTKDSDVTVTISNDVGVDNKYFHYSYSSSKKLLTIKIDDLSEDLVSDISVIPLKLAITDKSTQDTIFAVLNVEITSSNSKGGSSGTHSEVGLIVAVSILAGLLLLLLVAAFIYWFYKIRKAKYSEMINPEPEPPSKPTLFTKNETKKPYGSLSSAPLRRPTGLGVGLVDPIPQDTSTDEVDETPQDFPEVQRKVAFHDDVEKIEIDNETPGLQSVANRRPTEFVFGYPLESGLFDSTSDDRRESSDYNVVLSEERRLSLDLPEKKSVAFDENIERMHIDPVEADDSDDEEEEEEDQTFKQKRTEAEQHVTDEEQLPSQIFKEIF